MYQIKPIFMKNKKIIIIISIIIVAIVIALLLTVFGSGCSASKTKITQTNSDRTFYPFYVLDSNNLIYLSDLGIIWYQYNLDTQGKTTLTSDEILGVLDINYRPDGKNAVVYSDYPSSNIKHYDFSSNKTYDLNKYITSVIWGSQKQKIYYSYKRPKNNDDNEDYIFSIDQSDYSGENWQEIKDMTKSNYQNVYLYPSEDDTYIYYQPLTEDYLSSGSTLKRLLINTKQDEVMTDENIIFSKVVFSPDKTKIAFLDQNQKLNIQNIDDKSTTTQVYDESIDSIDKISWSNDNNSIYYLQDLDNLMSINTAKKTSKNISLDSQDVSSVDMLDDSITCLGVSADNQNLYFTYNNYIYNISLK